MPKPDLSTVDGRRNLVNYVLHENHLEGNEPTRRLTELLDQFVEGKISPDDIVNTIANRK